MEPFGRMICIDLSIRMARCLVAAFDEGQNIPYDSWQCREDCRAYLGRLDSVREQLGQWIEDWIEDSSPPTWTECFEILGQKHFLNITNVISQIGVHHGNVMYAMRDRPASSEADLKTEEWRAWQDMIPKSEIPDRAVMQRIAFALHDDSGIATHLARLESAISQLHKASGAAVAHLQSLDIGSYGSPSEQIQAVLELRTRRKRFMTMLTKLYNPSSKFGSPYGIILRDPDDQCKVDSFHKSRRICVDILIKVPTTSDRPAMRRVQVAVPYRSSKSQKLDDPQLLIDAINGTEQDKDWNRLRTVQKLEGRFESIVHASSENLTGSGDASSPSRSSLEVLDLALALTNWVLLLWSTPCDAVTILKRTRDHIEYKCHLEAIRDELLPQLDTSGTEISQSDTSHAASDQGQSEHIFTARATLLCLGTVLIELALDRGITLSFPDAKTAMFKFAGQTQYFTLEDLLLRLNKWPSYEKAVKWCFTYALGSTIRPIFAEKVLMIAKRILDPLADFHERLKHFSTSAETTEDEERYQESANAYQYRNVRREYRGNRFNDKSRNHLGDNNLHLYFNPGSPDSTLVFPEIPQPGYVHGFNLPRIFEGMGMHSQPSARSKA
ncbi:hypothetical protein HII31_10334 [Pseudocercospora fuligena]|uniref:Uncharacterized protein n=1 Tax=Pseudocercospora fuligena TaxID=685502 RepID=A0A8H6VIQ3_9PEZI|nr:hypothetical protein HII31_10334 [Pseudocercospora fuligena]